MLRSRARQWCSRWGSTDLLLFSRAWMVSLSSCRVVSTLSRGAFERVSHRGRPSPRQFSPGGPRRWWGRSCLLGLPWRQSLEKIVVLWGWWLRSKSCAVVARSLQPNLEFSTSHGLGEVVRQTAARTISNAPSAHLCPYCCYQYVLHSASPRFTLHMRTTQNKNCSLVQHDVITD